jgi:Protein of unknown function (DUF1566)
VTWGIANQDEPVMKFDLHNSSAWCRNLFACAMLTGATVGQAACPSTPTAERFAFSADGTEVTDVRTGLIWQRCSHGQTWTGVTCNGSVIPLGHEAALVLAQSRNPGNSAGGWRLPNVKELATLLDWGCDAPAIDGAAFPATPSWFTWSSTPFVTDSSMAWVVYFGPRTDVGSVDRARRFIEVNVRLVRSSS